MALPFILWGAAVLLAGTGFVKGAVAISDFSDAKDIGESARSRYEDAETSLQNFRDKTNSEFEALGKVKLSIFKNQITHLVEAIKKSKHASSKLADFDVNISVEELKEMERLILTSLEIERGLGTGAVTGALAAWGAYGSVGLLATASTGTTR